MKQERKAQDREDWNVLAALKQLRHGPGLVGLLAGLIIAVLVIALGFIVMTERKAVFDVARAELLGGQKVVAAHVGRTYHAARTLLSIVEEELSVAGDLPNPARADAFAGMLRDLSHELITIRLIDHSGNVLEMGADGRQHTAFNLADRAFFQDLSGKSPGALVYGVAIVGQERNTRVLPVGIKARTNELGVAYVAGGLRASDFGQTFDGLYVSAPGQIGVIDENGFVLATWPWVDELAGRRVPSKFDFAGAGDEVMVGEFPSLIGKGTMLVGVSRLDGLPLYVFSAFAIDDLQKRWFALIWLPILIGVLSAAVLIFFSVRIIRLMRQNEQETARAVDALRRATVADVAKKDFLANMSHELRTPLNGIIGYAELMESELFGKLGEQYKSYVGLIVKSGRNLLDVIMEILELSRMEAGIIEVRDEVVDIAAEVQFALMTMHDRIREREIEIDTHFRAGLPQLRVGRAHIKQVLTNIIGNAVKFNVQGGRMVIAGHCAPGEDFVIQVVDSGIGIPKDRIADLFVPFTQVAASDKRGHAGLGLGLAMSLTIVRAYGGDITVESDSGKGTTVFVTLPARLAVWASYPAHPYGVVRPAPSKSQK